VKAESFPESAGSRPPIWKKLSLHNVGQIRKSPSYESEGSSVFAHLSAGILKLVMLRARKFFGCFREHIAPPASLSVIPVLASFALYAS
jgi:hypothetical protein